MSPPSQLDAKRLELRAQNARHAGWFPRRGGKSFIREASGAEATAAGLRNSGRAARFRALARPPQMERWLSGRKHRTRNAAYLYGYRGFESHPLRQSPNFRRSAPFAENPGFPYRAWGFHFASSPNVRLRSRPFGLSIRGLIRGSQNWDVRRRLSPRRRSRRRPPAVTVTVT